MKTTDVYGLGNALVDVPVTISNEDFDKLSIPRGSSMLVTRDEQARLLAALGQGAASALLTSAGSVANSIVTITELAGTSAMGSRIGDDAYGEFYKQDFDRLNVRFGNPLVVGGMTGTSVVLITPDGERTMRTCLGVSSELSASDVSAEEIRHARWIFVEGYLFANGPHAQDMVTEAIQLAKAPHARLRAGVALTLADKSIVRHHRAAVDQALEKTDLLFANRGEAMELTGGTTAEDAFMKLKGVVPNAVVTAGPDGAFIRYGGVETHVPTLKLKPVDTTGAGDAFAGGFLYGITNGYSAEDAARGGVHLAGKVIMQYGARLATGTREAWEELGI